MSFISTNAFYQEEIILLDKDFEAPTPITEGQVINGNLQPFRARIELTNTGNELQNSGIITLRIPPDGTFVRKEPILINEGAKDNYIIQARIKQDRDKDGVYEEEGRLFRIIAKSQSLPSIAGGVFRDFFFDYEPLVLSTKAVTIKAEEEGTVDRGVIIDPILFEFVSGTEKDKTINVDLIKFKNHVVMEGNPVGGTLPMENAKFSSLWEHAKIRPEWDATTQYYDGTLGTNQSEVRILDPFLDEIRFFKAIQTTGNINRNPTTDPLKEAYWEEDFVTIPDYNKYASYKKDDIIVQPDSGPSPVDRFYKAIQDVPNNPTNLSIYKPAPFGTSYWADTGQTFLRGLNHPLFDSNAITIGRGGRTRFL